MAGRKVFGSEVLTSADVNEYLMSQTVMRFASASTRAAAIPTPTVGMITWLDSTGQHEIYVSGSWQRLTPSSWVIYENSTYSYPATGTISTLPALQGGSDASFSTPVPAGRTLDVELLLPRVFLGSSTTGLIRLVGGGSGVGLGVLDGAELSTGNSQGHAWNVSLRGRVLGNGGTVTVTPQAWITSGSMSLGASSTAAAPARLRYRIS